MKAFAAVVLILFVLAAVIQSCGDLAAGVTAAVQDAASGAWTEPTPEPEPQYDYVLNHNTKKFHYPDCASVADILPKNIEYFHGPRSLLIELGFVPCKRCNP